MVKSAFFTLGCMVAMWSYVMDSNFAIFYRNIDPALQPYVEGYYNTIKDRCPQRTKDLSDRYTIEFISRSDEYIGQCRYKINGYKVLINKEWWDNNNNESQKIQLVYHELAHCVIYKAHVTDRIHYMNPEMNNLPHELYMPQVNEDIDSFCAR